MSLKRIPEPGIETSAAPIGIAFSTILLVLTAMNAGPLCRDETNTFNLALKKMSLCHGSYRRHKNIPAVEYRQQNIRQFQDRVRALPDSFSIVTYPRGDGLTT